MGTRVRPHLLIMLVRPGGATFHTFIDTVIVLRNIFATTIDTSTGFCSTVRISFVVIFHTEGVLFEKLVLFDKRKLYRTKKTGGSQWGIGFEEVGAGKGGATSNGTVAGVNAKIKQFRALLRGILDKKFFLFKLTKIYA